VIRLTTLGLLIALSGCAGVPVAVVTGALGVSAGILRLDNTLLDAWLATRGEVRAPKATQ
jgi:hypothetical protein